MPLELTILMPCLNEAESIARCVRKARESLTRLGLKGEVLVADNGSTDRSPEIATGEGARVIHVRRRGYGNALRAGIAEARGQWIVMGDADDTYDFSDLGGFVEQMRQGADLVMGCRFPQGGGRILSGAMPFPHRWLGNPALSFVGRLFFRSRVRDFHCGLRAFRREAIERIHLRTTGMEFASEMIVKAELYGLKIAEVPVTLSPDARTRSPHLRTWRDGWRHLSFMLLYSPRWLFLIPGMVLILLGGVLGLRLWLGPLVVGSVGFDTNTLLACSMAVVLGFQLCLFAVFTKIFAVEGGLLPRSNRYESLFQIFTLERGLLAGAILILAGLGFFLRAVWLWREVGFGSLSYPDSLRLVIPAVTMITIGTQTVFSSFFLSILGLRRR
jgi:glycosyltransferase involved in cell wall biosynthesis